MDLARFAGQALQFLPIPFLALEAVEEPTGNDDLRVVWANPLAIERFGAALVGSWLDRDEPLGTTEAIVPETGVAPAGVRTVERPVQRDGRTEHLRCTLIPADDGAAMLVEDITSEAEARADLASAGMTLARVEEWGNLGVWEVDLATGSTYWSTQVFQILGVDEAGHEHFRRVVHPEDLAHVDHVVRRLLDQPGPYRLTHRIVNGDDVRTLDQHMQSVPGEDGRPVRLLGTMIDVTAVHALQNQVRQTQSMRALGLLAGGLAHDFNNVLMVVRGHADLLLAQVGPDDPTRANLEAISRAGERASSLTRKLMSIGREEKLQSAPFVPAELLEEVAQLVRPAMRPAIEVDVEVAPGAEAMEMVADVDQLNKVLIDLVLNARDAGARRITLCLGTERLRHDDPRREAGRLPAGEYGLVQVRDDGQGMDDATRERAFEPFFSTKDSATGSGLGLATAHSFAQRSRGTLLITSAPGQGTTMSLLLPVDVRSTDVREPSGRGRRSRVRILVASADRERSEELTASLAGLGHQLVSVEDLDAMRFSLASEPIDLVVVDDRLLSGALARGLDGVPSVVVGHETGTGVDSRDGRDSRAVHHRDEDGLRAAVSELLQGS